MRILLVEDSATLRAIMEAFIKEAGHEPVVAEDGETAVQLVETQRFDMILMDVEMPGLNGFETTLLIRESLGEHWIPIIFVTGEAEDKSVEEGIAAGGDDYLIKPISKVILLAKIRAMERIVNMRKQLHKLNEELTHLSQRDGLTQLYNRRTFDEKAESAWRIAARAKEPISLILFDIDHFKLYNDNYGHQAGDECIQKVARAAESCLHRPGDVLARYGGEEFIVLLPNTDADGAYFIAEKLRASIEALAIEHSASQCSDIVTVSVGVSNIRFTHCSKLDDLIETADKALYDSKATGRNRCSKIDFKHHRKVTLIDCSADKTLPLGEILNSHCSLTMLESEEHIDLDAISPKTGLIIAVAESQNDKSLSVVKRIYTNGTMKKVPLMIISNDMDIESTQKIDQQFNAECMLQTPFDAHQLIARIDHILTKAS